MGYSKLLITEQSEQIQKLREIMRGTVAAAQDELAREGYYHGPIDGVFSEDTHRAVKDFQRDNGLNETGYLSRETRNALELDVK